MEDLIRQIRTKIDLRSDTGTVPTEEMWAAINHAAVGDGGRLELSGRGEDPTVYRLERLAAEMTGKEDAIFFSTGILANFAALLTMTERGDKVLLEKNAHIYMNERFVFMEKGSGLVPVFYSLNKDYLIDAAEIKAILADNDIKVLCLENTHNYSGGTCLTVQNTAEICAIAHAQGIHVHMDGARIFNAAIAQKVAVKELVRGVDSMMFCISKGLSAPVGSVLVGSSEFIKKARKIAKLTGAVMRQAGVIAAAGIVALEQCVERMQEDHDNAALLASLIKDNKKIICDPCSVQTNMLYLDVTPMGINAQTATAGLREAGLLVSKMTDTHIRLVISRGITEKDIHEAARVINGYFGKDK